MAPLKSTNLDIYQVFFLHFRQTFSLSSWLVRTIQSSSRFWVSIWFALLQFNFTVDIKKAPPWIPERCLLRSCPVYFIDYFMCMISLEMKWHSLSSNRFPKPHRCVGTCCLICISCICISLFFINVVSVIMQFTSYQFYDCKVRIKVSIYPN